MTTEWVTVPREPTEAMVAAGRSYAVPSTQAIIPIYTAMLSASPVPPSEPVEWRTIDSAPTNKRILLWWRTCKEPSVGYFDVDDLFDTRPPNWRSPECGWRSEGDRCIPINQNDCTHWMPLPPVPGSAVHPSPPVRGEVVEALKTLGSAAEWSEKREALLKWTGSAIAGEKPIDEGTLSELYGFLCGLIGWLVSVENALAKMEERS